MTKTYSVQFTTYYTYSEEEVLELMIEEEVDPTKDNLYDFIKQHAKDEFADDLCKNPMLIEFGAKLL